MRFEFLKNILGGLQVVAPIGRQVIAKGAGLKKFITFN